ncbi:hypothetical protein CC80DRAFT_496304 [Byssothecium circinans]|uniref:Uncharacterized protein n=1 Tax=Byssothecium circinans TaxID=147558 RepID=A0A6A5TH89_9PLEO|nr:hypothetical protein CC80DRAFT_496304 [Byssothecium circinans]
MDIDASSSSSTELPLIPRDGSGLSQQGSINWDNIVHRSLTFTVGVLNRCANAGVDPYSLVVGQAVAQCFPLARRGRENVYTAVTALRCQNGIANTLWFGFGVKALVRTLILTSEGTSLLAICACLGECFHEDLAPDIMFHIVKAHGAPGELTPSVAQWAAIIKACSGSLATSKFPLLAEGLMRLDPGSGRTTMMNETPMTKENSQRLPFIRGCPLPQDLASVVIAVGKVASGQLESIHVSGCAAIGWVGAIAEWLFDLRVVIYTAQDESTPVYSNFPDNQEAQVHLTFDCALSASVSQSRLHVVRKSYFLPNSISLFDWGEQAKVLYSGRVPWESCLTDTFGYDFERLRKMPLNFGTALGCAARIFKAIVTAESGVPKKYLQECRSYFDASAGQGFVHNALHWFPELSPLKQAMEKASRLSFDAAKDGYEEKFAAIQRSCECSVCRDFDHFEEGEGFCLVIIMEAIIVLCLVTAGLTVTEHLHPLRIGLESFYKRQLQVRSPDEDEDDQGEGSLQEGLRTVGPIIYVLFTNGFVDLTLEQYTQALESRLVAAIKLFTGRDTPTHLTASAVSESGICAYLDILRDISISPESAGRVHVVPGMIEHDHKPFPQVQDNEIELMRRAGSVKELCATLAELNEVILEVTETVHSLSINFLFQRRGDDTKDESRPYLRIGPGDIVDQAHRARGLVHCSTPIRSCKRRRIGGISCDRAEYPILKLSMDGETIQVCDTTNGGEYLRAVALRVATEKNPPYFCLLSDGRCIDCCIGTVVNQNIRPALVIANVGNATWSNSR